jgi:PAS domain S-box-containing protein
MNRSRTDRNSPDVGPIEHLGESELLHLADLVPQMIWMCTPQGANIYFNQRWVDFTGMSLEESYGEGWNKPFHPDDQERAWRAWNHAVQTGDTYQVESRIRAAGGTYRWFLMRGEPFKEADGRTVKWFGTCTDIHDLKLAETALLRSEKLISAGRMAASVAHEINNPLAAVTNLLFLAKSSEELSTIRSYIDGAEAELNRVAHIARQSLGFYRESTSPALSYAHRLLESAIELLKAKVIAKQAAIETRWRDDVQVSVVAGEVLQVFANLLANSLEAIPSKGIVKIRTSLVFDHKNQIPCLRVTVADNGRGIPDLLLPQLFEPFFTTKDTTGIGLGLWVSKQILDKHSGTIRVRSTAEGDRTGTVVRVSFPIKALSVQEQASEKSFAAVSTLPIDA